MSTIFEYVCDQCRRLVESAECRFVTLPDRNCRGFYVVQEYFHCPYCNYRNVVGVELRKN